MNKYICMALSLWCAQINACDRDKSIMCFVGSTLFSVIQDNVINHSEYVDLMVVGSNEQQKIQGLYYKNNNAVGSLVKKTDEHMYVLPKSSDTNSQDDSYKPYGSYKQNLGKRAEKKVVKCDLFEVMEPRITLESTYDMYEPMLYFYSKTNEDQTLTENFFGDNAIKNASNDLATCYKIALKKGLEVIQDKENKSIAISALSTEVGFPRDIAAPIAFKSIISFLLEHKEYSSVQLFIKKRSEFKCYKELVREYNNKK